jgi:hypothetical protein
MKMWEFNLFYNYIKLTYTSTLWRLGATLITYTDGLGRYEAGIEIQAGPYTLWAGYIGR